MNSKGILSSDPYPLKSSRNNDQYSSNEHSYHPDLKMPFPTERNQHLKKWLIAGLGQVMYKVSVQQFIPDSKEANKHYQGMSKGLKSQALMAKDGTIWTLIRII